jgi:uncharacterized integral membrane protein
MAGGSEGSATVQSLLKFLRVALFVLLVLIAIIAMVENQEPVRLAFLGWDTALLPVYWWLVIAFVLGGVCGWLVSGISLIRERAGARRARSELERSRAEIDTLRRPSSDPGG